MIKILEILHFQSILLQFQRIVINKQNALFFHISLFQIILKSLSLHALHPVLPLAADSSKFLHHGQIKENMIQNF